MGFSEGCGGFEFGVLHWAELAKPQRERERDGGKSGIFSRERTERIFLKERDWRVIWFFEKEREICSYRFSRTVAVSKK